MRVEDLSVGPAGSVWGRHAEKTKSGISSIFGCSELLLCCNAAKSGATTASVRLGERQE